MFLELPSDDMIINTYSIAAIFKAGPHDKLHAKNDKTIIIFKNGNGKEGIKISAASSYEDIKKLFWKALNHGSFEDAAIHA